MLNQSITVKDPQNFFFYSIRDSILEFNDDLTLKGTMGAVAAVAVSYILDVCCNIPHANSISYFCLHVIAFGLVKMAVDAYYKARFTEDELISSGLVCKINTENLYKKLLPNSYCEVEIKAAHNQPAVYGLVINCKGVLTHRGYKREPGFKAYQKQLEQQGYTNMLDILKKQFKKFTPSIVPQGHYTYHKVDPLIKELDIHYRFTVNDFNTLKYDYCSDNEFDDFLQEYEQNFYDCTPLLKAAHKAYHEQVKFEVRENEFWTYNFIHESRVFYAVVHKKYKDGGLDTRWKYYSNPDDLKSYLARCCPNFKNLKEIVTLEKIRENSECLPEIEQYLGPRWLEIKRVAVNLKPGVYGMARITITETDTEIYLVIVNTAGTLKHHFFLDDYTRHAFVKDNYPGFTNYRS